LSKRPALNSRLALTFALIVGAAGLLGYWAWQASVRQQRLGRDLLRSAAFVAGQRYGNRVGIQLYNGASVVFRPLNGGRFGVPPSTEPRLMFDGARAARECRCAPVLEPAFVFKSRDDTALATVPALDPAQRASLIGLLRRRPLLRGSWDIALMPEIEPETRSLVFLAPGSDSTLYGFGVRVDTVRNWILYPVLTEAPLFVHEGAAFANDSAVALEVFDRAGRSVFKTTTPVNPAYASRYQLGDIWSGWSVSVSLQPAAAQTLLAGGLPDSPLSALILLLGVTAVLFAVALVLIWRMLALARLQTDFTSSVSHELRTPLTQILLYAETIEMERHESVAEQRRAIGVVTREARRLIHLVENVLRMAGTERGVNRLRLRVQPLRALVEETVADFTPLAESRDVRVAVDATGDANVSVDAAALRQILLNLLDNALRYGPRGQTIDVVVTHRDDWIRIAVLDDGPGVAAKDADRIWRPFVRLPGPASETGAGIGLAIVRDLALEMNGRYGVERTSAGRSLFFVELPRASVSAPVPEVVG
jgi:signal transduction histidine kinase